MASANESCPAAELDFDFGSYLDICRKCISPNPDVAGLGIIVGIILQAALMNFCVALWWLAGLGVGGLWNDLVRCYKGVCYLICAPRMLSERIRDRFYEFGNSVREYDGNAEESVVELGPRRRLLRRVMQKLFKTWSDTQAVTGIALLFAALFQGNGGDLSVYHTAIILDLISLAADGQAIMLFYALRSDPASTPKVSGPPLDSGSSHRIDRGLWPRLLSSIIFIVLYFIFVAKAYVRYRDSDECFLHSKPITGNYGAWSIASAVLVLLVYIAVFIPQHWTESRVGELKKWAAGKIAFLYPERPTSTDSPTRYSKVAALSHFLKQILPYFVWIIAKFIKWLYDRELSFPLGSFTYFLLNAIDVQLLRQTNEPLLVNGGPEEKTLDAFGQIVPIVMVFAVALPLSDLMEAERTKTMTGNNQHASTRTEISMGNIARVDGGSYPEALCTDLEERSEEVMESRPR